MVTLRARWFVCLMLVGCSPEREDGPDEASAASGGSGEGTFACGAHGGTCDAATELCIVGGSDMCSTCVPLPAECDGDATCGCVPPGTDPVWGSFACEDAGSCAAADGGRVLTCSDVTWGCG